MTDFETARNMLEAGQIDEAFEKYGETMFVEVETQPDNWQRQRFWLHWLTDNIGWSRNERGMRGQIFFAVLEPHLLKYRRTGRPIIFIDS